MGVSYLQKVVLDFKGSVYVQCSMGQFEPQVLAWKDNLIFQSGTLATAVFLSPSVHILPHVSS